MFAHMLGSSYGRLWPTNKIGKGLGSFYHKEMNLGWTICKIRHHVFTTLDARIRNVKCKNKNALEVLKLRLVYCFDIPQNWALLYNKLGAKIPNAAQNWVNYPQMVAYKLVLFLSLRDISTPSLHAKPLNFVPLKVCTCVNSTFRK